MGRRSIALKRPGEPNDGVVPLHAFPHHGGCYDEVVVSYPSSPAWIRDTNLVGETAW